MALTREQFRNAISHLTGTGSLSGVGALFIDINNQKVLDEGSANLDITPDALTLDQALIDLATVQSDQITQDTTDNTAFADLLSKAQAGITQIANDKTAVQNATIPSEVKTVLANVLNRQEEIIKAMAGAIRKLS